MAPSDQVEQITEIYQALFNIKLLIISCYVVVVYDYLCTLDEEAKYVWNSRWSIGLLLFYLNRYLVFVGHALLLSFTLSRSETTISCGHLFKSGIWISNFSGSVSSIIVYMQTCAVWGNRRIIVIPLLVIHIIRIVASIVITHLQWDVIKYPARNGVCGVGEDHGLVRYRFLLVCLTEGVTVAALLFKAVQHIRGSNSSWVIQLYRNGVLYSIIIFLLALLNMVLPEVRIPNGIYKGVLTRPLYVAESILCNRVMFVIFQYRKRGPRASLLTNTNGLKVTTANIFTSIIESNISPNHTTDAIEMQPIEDGDSHIQNRENWIS
ncbi:hypothetical protein FA15DRAFT_706683 [Coprinopsis marcescibilis]|uniref:DUF6533 domain-containing protein n=1 Tax=Coprinopsis marcescibilis TaxID=230819 RepID=A0A5C3KNZ7_COPMA|nr:hypothetical protein FA15DRAFT_706683 [Coprinopsis marcescibilis]